MSKYKHAVISMCEQVSACISRYKHAVKCKHAVNYPTTKEQRTKNKEQEQHQNNNNNNNNNNTNIRAASMDEGGDVCKPALSLSY